MCDNRPKIDPYDIADIQRDIDWDLNQENRMRQRSATKYRKAEMQEVEDEII